jgi:hypothetical protein
LNAFFAAADTFFRLPTADKGELYPGPVDNTELGYHHVPDEKQFVTFRYAAAAHSSPPDIEKLLGQTWHDVAHLLYRVLIDVGRFLGIDNAAWLPLVERSLTLPVGRPNITTSLLRVFRYEPNSGVADPHADLGLLTLCVGKGKGLQVWDLPVADSTMASGGSNEPGAPASIEADRWRDAGEVTLLVGDTLRVLSNNRFISAKHRVVSNPCGRDSIVFALRPDLNTVLDLRLYGGEGLVPTKALWDRIRTGRVNVNAQKAVREKVRREAADRRKQQEGEAGQYEAKEADTKAEVKEQA